MNVFLSPPPTNCKPPYDLAEDVYYLTELIEQLYVHATHRADHMHGERCALAIAGCARGSVGGDERPLNPLANKIRIVGKCVDALRASRSLNVSPSPLFAAAADASLANASASPLG
jgi:hypothetical protein